MHGAGFEAVQVLLWLVQGAEAKAKESLTQLRRSMPAEPLSAALVGLAEYTMNVETAHTIATTRRRGSIGCATSSR